MTAEPTPMTGSTDAWTAGPLVALDLEGSGAQDRANEAILEIAIVPLIAGQPDTAAPRRRDPRHLRHLRRDTPSFVQRRSPGAPAPTARAQPGRTAWRAGGVP